MRILQAAILGAVVALPLSLVGSPAHAQDVLGQIQRLFNGNNDQNAYERGRQDQMRRQQAERERWRTQHRYGRNEHGHDWRGREDHGWRENAPRHDNRYSYSENSYHHDYGYQR